MSFECPVCYSKCESGLVIPQSCQHKICLTCYTNIVIKNPQGPCCPQCRKAYVKKEDLVSQESPVTHNQLIDPFDNLIFETAISNVIRRSPIENLLYETAISHSRRSPYIYTRMPLSPLFYINDF
jgi:hypothetical protein